MVIIVIDTIFSARKQNWPWTWPELEGAKQARSILAIGVFSAFALPTDENTCNQSVGLAFWVMKTFFKRCHICNKNISVPLIIVGLCGFNKS